MNPSFKVVAISVDENGKSIFTEREYPSHERGGMLLSDQIQAKNFRFRESAVGYATDCHVAGDTTLIMIQQGNLKITLQCGKWKVFNAGEMFIAGDNILYERMISFNIPRYNYAKELKILGSSLLSVED